MSLSLVEDGSYPPRAQPIAKAREPREDDRARRAFRSGSGPKSPSGCGFGRTSIGSAGPVASGEEKRVPVARGVMALKRGPRRAMTDGGKPERRSARSRTRQFTLLSVSNLTQDNARSQRRDQVGKLTGAAGGA